MTDAVSLLATTEAFAMALLADAIGNGKDGAKPPLSERTAALKAVTSFLAVQNKLEPPPDDKESEVAEFQRQLAPERPAAAIGRARRYRGDPVAKNETLTGDAA